MDVVCLTVPKGNCSCNKQFNSSPRLSHHHLHHGKNPKDLSSKYISVLSEHSKPVCLVFWWHDLTKLFTWSQQLGESREGERFSKAGSKTSPRAVDNGSPCFSSSLGHGSGIALCILACSLHALRLPCGPQCLKSNTKQSPPSHLISVSISGAFSASSSIPPTYGHMTSLHSTQEILSKDRGGQCIPVMMKKPGQVVMDLEMKLKLGICLLPFMENPTGFRTWIP